MSEEEWVRVVDEIVERSRRILGSIEAVILFGSWARSGGGVWSDIDLLLVSEEIKSLSLLERFRLAVDLGGGRIDLFIYTYKELEKMALRGNPLVLSALGEGRIIVASERIMRLAEEIKTKYRRVGRMWIRVSD